MPLPKGLYISQGGYLSEEGTVACYLNPALLTSEILIPDMKQYSGVERHEQAK